MVEARWPRWVAGAALAAVLALGCGGGGKQNTVGSASGSGGTTAASGTGGTTTASGTGGTTTASGTGGTGGATASSSSSSSSSSGSPHGPAATETVNAGTRAVSGSYVMVFTLGQPTQNQNRTSSQSYVLQGGLVGANGSLP
jgi:hypothetical protein